MSSRTIGATSANAHSDCEECLRKGAMNHKIKAKVSPEREREKEREEMGRMFESFIMFESLPGCVWVVLLNAISYRLEATEKPSWPAERNGSIKRKWESNKCGTLIVGVLSGPSICYCEQTSRRLSSGLMAF